MASVVTAFKRMKNILRQAAEKGIAIPESFSADDLQDAAELELAAQEPMLAATMRECKQQGDYSEGMRKLIALRPLLDAFFGKVMVMVEDERLRANRLALLRALVGDFMAIADFSLIVEGAQVTK